MTDMKIAFWTVLAAGFVACSTLGIGPSLARAGGNWGAPAMVAGSVLGVAILVLATAFAAGARPAFLSSDAAMVYALVGLVVAKVGVSVLQSIASAATRG
jgi:hypothetical protein